MDFFSWFFSTPVLMLTIIALMPLLFIIWYNKEPNKLWCVPFLIIFLMVGYMNYLVALDAEKEMQIAGSFCSEFRKIDNRTFYCLDKVNDFVKKFYCDFEKQNCWWIK